MQASSLERRLWTMSLRVEMMASRLWLVRSEVSIRIPSETASCGAASARGPSGSRAGDIELRSGSRRVSSKPNAALALMTCACPNQWTLALSWREQILKKRRLLLENDLNEQSLLLNLHRRRQPYCPG